MIVRQSSEDYLETILLLERSNDSVRSVDVAKAMGFTKPSVTRAMGVLKENGFIEENVRGGIVLTSKGRQRAKEIYRRHEIIKTFLHEKLGVSIETAEEDACKIEHIISRETLNAIKDYK